MRFRNRTEAGRILASRLLPYREAGDLLVLGLPRGGVAVAGPVAERLEAPLGVFVVRKVGVPSHEELAMGAVASGGVVVRNQEVLRALGISEDEFRQAARREQQEVARRERLYHAEPTIAQPRGRTVVLVDDGLATGATMRAVIQAVREREPARLVVAVPVAARAIAEKFRAMLDDFVCVHEPDELDGVGRWYEDFEQTSDDEVRRLLEEAARRQRERSQGGK
jgi:putative phosphoribosyl transferase